jgi:pilus assembly protein CpaE
MRSLVVSDNQSVAGRVRQVLVRSGLECPEAHLVTLELAADRASRLVPALVVIVVPPESERALAALREINNTVQTSLLVVGPAHDPKFILTTLHAGADEYLDETRLEDELAEALIRLKTRQAKVDAIASLSGRVISVLSPSGGSGASLVAANLATVLAKEHGAVGLLDLRLAVGDLAHLMDLKPTHSMADLCENLERIDHDLFDQFFIRHFSQVHLLAAPLRPAACQNVSPKGLRQILAMARRRFPYTVADLDRTFGDLQLEILMQSETIVLVIRLDYTSVRNTRQVLEQLRELGLNGDRTYVVVNRYGERKQLSIAQAEAALEMKIQLFIPDDPAHVNNAVNVGTPIVIQRPSAKVSRRLVELAANLNGHHASSNGVHSRP